MESLDGSMLSITLSPAKQTQIRNTTMNRNFHRIQDDNATAESFGKEIAEALNLKKISVNHRGDFYDTTWGLKTDIGLARILHTILTSPKPD